MEKLVRAVVQELKPAWLDARARTGFTVPESVRILGYSLETPDVSSGASGQIEDFGEFGGNIYGPTILVKREGGIRFDPVYYSRITLYSFAGDQRGGGNELEGCWDIDNISTLAMERLGVFRYRGQKFGPPVGESDGIPAYEESTKRYYVYRSFLISNVGP